MDLLPGASPAVAAAFRFGLGLCVGSFLNVVIHRLPAGESLFVPRSRCPGCAASIRAVDNVPLLSWLALRGRCRDCRAPISLRYPVVELLTGCIAVHAGAGGDPVTVVTRLLFLGLLLVLAFIDWERLVLPDVLTLPGAALGLALAGPRTDLDLFGSAAGGAVGAALLWLLRRLWLRLRGIEAVGLGDVKLLLMIGAFLGPAATLAAIALGSAIGVAVAAPLLALGRIRRDTPLPFGSLLSIGAAAAFVLATGG